MDIRYNRQDGVDVSKWQLATPKTLRQQEESQIQDDLRAYPTWAGQAALVVRCAPVEQATSGQRRWKVTYRVKNGLDPSVEDWVTRRRFPVWTGFTIVNPLQ
jgi:hypothetical protein